MLALDGDKRRMVSGSTSAASLTAQINQQIDGTRWRQRAPVQALFNQKGSEMGRSLPADCARLLLGGSSRA